MPNLNLDNQKNFDPLIASRAIVDGLKYLKKRLGWSNIKICTILHLSPHTLGIWLNNETIPIENSTLHPDVQVIIHLLAIHRSLEVMFNDSANQRQWLSTIHPELNDIPEKVMGKSIDGLIHIRQYLDSVRERGA